MFERPLGELKPYVRKINYYETDQMQVVHHSNYARFLEECRLDLLEQADMDYAMLEKIGVIVPVLELHECFRLSVTFGDTIRICPKIEKVSPVRFTVTYNVYDENTKELKHTAESSHAFVDTEFKPMNLKKKYPEVFERFCQIKELGEIGSF